ncbi:MMPL family transporter [Blastococcus sp. Marseille-P5729]|uniref:MMPL family transporter n=1 Tax=Blastococcus sp. Marseille-P5729 TaxID=2086582 RepID=UPI000D0F7B40|nr:MMPL family transporter [Blastococcus sp. Marseille-P5729]
MATLLYRIGHFCYRNRKGVLAAWLVVLIGMATAAGLLMGKFSPQFSIPGLQSQTALDKLTEKVPAAGGTTGRVVLQAEDGPLATPAHDAQVEAMVSEISGMDGVASVTPPIPGTSISPTEPSIGYITIVFSDEIGAIPVATLESIEKVVGENDGDGLRAEIGGAAAQQMPAIGSTEGIGVAIAVVVLLITFGSILAAGLPLLTALIGLGIGISGILIVSGFVTMSDTAPILALMLGMAVGIDYALFIVSKHRDQLRRGLGVEESISRANATAGTAVVFAGLTVIIALAALTVVGIPFLGVMGLGSAFTVIMAVLVATTLVPALLGFAGYRVLPKKERTDIEARVGQTIAAEEHHTPNRWIRFIDRRPLVALLGGVLLLGLIAIPATQLRLGLPTDSTAGPETSKRQAYDLVVEGFGEGANNPLLLLVEPDSPQLLDPQTAAGVEAQVQQQLMQQAAENPQLAKYGTPEMLQMAVDQAKADAVMKPYIDQIAGVENVASVQAITGTPDGLFYVLQVVPGSGASDQATVDLVNELRSVSDDLGEQNGANVEVTGLNVVEMDISQKLADALPIYLAIVVGLALILLFFVFRSLIVPIKAVLGFLLSIAASFGAVVAVYQLGWLQGIFGVDTPAPIISFLPVLLIGILFGLSMDYEMFLVSGMREAHAHGLPARKAVTTGYMAGSRVVTAAAIIMISVFAGFIMAPDTIIASIGFALAVGVMFDAFVVRMTIVPAVMRLLGEKAWYLPRWMDKAIPHADVEGTKLLAKLEAADHKSERETELV